jgi:hypothetical protein
MGSASRPECNKKPRKTLLPPASRRPVEPLARTESGEMDAASTIWNKTPQNPMNTSIFRYLF